MGMAGKDFALDQNLFTSKTAASKNKTCMGFLTVAELWRACTVVKFLSLALKQDGQCRSQPCANNGKYLMYQKKIISDQIKKYQP